MKSDHPVRLPIYNDYRAVILGNDKFGLEHKYNSIARKMEKLEWHFYTIYINVLY